MPISVRLSAEEEALLEKASRRSARSKSDIVKQGVREVCARLVRGEQSPFAMGKDLFGAGKLAAPPADAAKRAIWEKLNAKHGRDR
ncbi:MAG: TraY domain-containing protein [Betaproteobacteria bacterium]|nr:TraY domain-containing protein [Betaproteobacteria bacterium]